MGGMMPGQRGAGGQQNYPPNIMQDYSANHGINAVASGNDDINRQER